MDVSNTRYTATAKALHWLIVMLVLAQFVVAALMPHIGRNTVAGTVINLHFSLGVLILLVMAVRLVHRFRHPVPLEMPESPAWEHGLAYASQIVFYLMLLVGPVLGWASASAHNLRVTVFGLVTLPDLAAPKTRWALVAGDVHTWMMWTLLGLIAIHAAAGLYHYFVLHDRVLQRMLPERS
jgi:cytochrome b561